MSDQDLQPVVAAALEEQHQQQQEQEADPRPRIDPAALDRFLQSDAKVQCYPVVEGLRRTAPAAVLSELSLVSGSQSVKELVRNAEFARHRWQRLNIFSDIEFNLEPLADGNPDDVVIRFLFTERKTFKEISVMSSESSAMPEIKATLNNVLGRGYELSAHVTPSTLRTLSYSAHLTSHIPFLGEKTEYVVARNTENHALHYGDQERVEQAKVVVHFDNSATIAAEEALRSNHVALRNSSGGSGSSSDEATNPEGKEESLKEVPPAHWRQTVSFGFQRRRIIPRDSTAEVMSSSSAPNAGGGLSSPPSAAAANSYFSSQHHNLSWRGIPSWLQHHFAPSTKAFLKYELRYNTVQHLPMPWFEVFSLPVSGTDFCGSAEVAGGLLGGSTSLAKAEVQCLHHRTLFPFVVLDLGFRGGFAAGLGGSDWAGTDARWGDSLALMDRFYLNWRNVRGFLALGPNTNTEAEMRGEGDRPPRRFRCLGGNAVWAASATLNFPFPLWPSNGVVSSHVFANVGNLALMENAAHALSSIGELLTKPKASVGCGLTAMQVPGLGPVPNGRLELNFSVPVGGGGSGESGTGVSLSSPWVFDKLRWGLHWTAM